LPPTRVTADIPATVLPVHGDVMGTKVAGFLRHAFSQWSSLPAT
jgi:hypothetical protein